MSEADAALDLLRRLGAADIPHPGGRLLAHLQRTHDQLVAWDQPPAVRLSGLCHATYGTDGFPQALLPIEDRAILRDAIGDEAEQLVYVYGACDRKASYPRIGEHPLRLTDRFTGEIHTLDEQGAVAFAALTIANELDVVQHGDLPPGAVAQITQLLQALTVYTPGLASAVAAEA
jgi:hypothetical protein